MKKLLYIFLAAILTGSLAGCKKYLDKLDNPNLVTDPPLNGLLAQGTYRTGYSVFEMGDITSYYVQYLAGNTKGSDADVYNPVDYSTTWSDAYASMMNIRQMILKAQTDRAWLHLGVGQVLMALNLNMLINTFGDVPYSNALEGKNNIIPAFDKQQALHDSCQALLDAAITNLQRTDASLNLDAGSDVIHTGDAAAWLKTAYALKARFLNQWSKTSSYDAAGILSALGNAYTSNADDAALLSFNGRSPWNGAAYNNTQLALDGWLSSQIVNAMNGTNYPLKDPRLPHIATITKFGDYRGTQNGAGRMGTGTSQEESYLSVNGFYSATNAPLLIVTYAETKFIEAEAALRSGDPGRAYDAYLDGIRANMDKVGVAAADRDTYVNDPGVSVGKANISLDLIFKEKYVAMLLNPEAWVDARRYDYKYRNFSLPVGAAMPAFIRRLNYPTIEISRNASNIPPITGLDQRLVWDQ
ncbi:MAG TPA: SusD/RagB family nutrient-binding outer membrane lipoprotein [Puia sp.]|jgi:hypothetical protein